jgi:hypothetical protein
MKLNRSLILRTSLVISLVISLTVLADRIQADSGSCGGATITLPFTDVMGSTLFPQAF